MDRAKNTEEKIRTDATNTILLRQKNNANTRLPALPLVAFQESSRVASQPALSCGNWERHRTSSFLSHTQLYSSFY